MPAFFTFFSVGIQLSGCLWLIIHLFKSFNPAKRIDMKFRLWHTVVELIILILLAFCFILSGISSFHNEPHFFEFSILTLVGVIFYFISKLDFKSKPHSREVNLCFVATLFWLSVFTVIKFIPYLTYFWFPILGLLAITPTLLAILCLTEIRYRNVNRRLSSMQILLLGLIPIIALQLYMNTYTESTWAFIELFDPLSTNIY